jgi:hypothetical protein
MVLSASTVRDISSAADKQLETMYKTVKPLKEVGPHKFTAQLTRQAYAYGWPPHILDRSIDDLTDEERKAQHDDPNQSEAHLKNIYNIRNAFLVISTSCDGHQVENLMEMCPQGHARKAYDIVCTFFNPKTTSGKSEQYQSFFGSSMASSHTNIVEWVALVTRSAKDLISVGGQVDESAQISVLLSGLLPEFKDIKLQTPRANRRSRLQRGHKQAHGPREKSQAVGPVQGRRQEYRWFKRLLQ